MTADAIATALKPLKDFNSRGFDAAMTAALTHQAAHFSFPVVAPSPTGDRYDLVALQRLNMDAGKNCGTAQTTQVGFVPAGAFALAGHFPSFYNCIGAVGHAPQAALRFGDPLGGIVVTQSSSSALAINSGGSGSIAIAALDPLNIRPLATWARAQGKSVVIVPDNSDLSRAVARDAARATGAKVVSPAYKPGQPNLLAVLSDAVQAAHARLPLWDGKADPADKLANASLRLSAEKAAYADLIHGPITDAKPWAPGVGRADRIAEASRSMPSGTEIGR